VLSRVCGIYANYKDAFDKHPTPLVSFYSSDTLVAFNSCVRDLYNLLWGSKALQVVEHSPAFFCTPALREALNSYLARTEHEYAIGLAFGLSHNAWLASLSAAAWWSLEEDEIEQKGYDRDSITWHKGPVTIHTLEALEKNGGVSVTLLQYKKYVLHWLANRGCSGLKNLMYTTHAKLRK
jgi:centromere protein I